MIDKLRRQAISLADFAVCEWRPRHTGKTQKVGCLRLLMHATQLWRVARYGGLGHSLSTFCLRFPGGKHRTQPPVFVVNAASFAPGGASATARLAPAFGSFERQLLLA